MRVCIHRGSNQIGGSCVEVEQDGQRILIDLGLPLDAEDNDSRYLPPGIKGLDGGDPSLLGILISHPHLDHFGLLAHISPNIPIGMGGAARRILASAAPFLPGNWPIPSPGWEYKSGHDFAIGPFRVTPLLVDHSAYDAYGLLIESGGKRLFYSGDFRAHGRKAALFEQMLANPPKGIDALLVEGSSLGRIGDDQHFPSESDVEAQLTNAFSVADGLALVHTSAQNIDRIVSIFRASKRTGRKLVIDLYAAAILDATGNEAIPQSDWPDVALFVPQAQRRQVKENAWFHLLKQHASNRIFIEDLQQAPKKSTLLFRPLHRFDLERGKCLAGATYFYSQWEGYWEAGSYDAVKGWLERHGIAKQSIHTSGHASPADLKTFVAALMPRKVIPIHSFMPERYAELFANVEAHADGEWWNV
jgi:ribonuclease J